MEVDHDDEHADDQGDEADQGKEQEEAGARVGEDVGQVLEPQASLGVSVIQTMQWKIERRGNEGGT